MNDVYVCLPFPTAPPSVEDAWNNDDDVDDDDDHGDDVDRHKDANVRTHCAILHRTALHYYYYTSSSPTHLKPKKKNNYRKTY